MAPVTIYSRPGCSYCAAAKELLHKKGVTFEEFDIWAEPERRAEMIERSNGGTTVPQIFIAGRHVGGCDDLYALEGRGALDPLLEPA